jgi:hypothetical protein
MGNCKLRGVFEAFESLGAAAEPVVYADDWITEVRDQLLTLDGVLVWVNPIERGLDRSKLDDLLREVSAAGVWVSAHPDVIKRMATKQVLHDTRGMSWGTDTRLYVTPTELRESLATLGKNARVLKQQRGMGGQGVWKVERDPSDDDALRVQEAIRGAIQSRLTLDRVVGFAHQYPAGLRPDAAGEPPPGKTFEVASAPHYSRLRESVESMWVPQMHSPFLSTRCRA